MSKKNMYKDAVKKYQENPTSETLKEVCKELCDEMTLKEKRGMISGSALGMGKYSTLGGIRYGTVYNICPNKGVERLGVPAVKFMDGPRGPVMGHSTCFPVSMARGASFNDELEYKVGKVVAEELSAWGANYFAGICINLLRHPAWGRAQESYGEDPYLLGRMGSALTRAVQDNGVIACPKHYACNSIEDLRFSVDVKVDERTLQEVYLPHFKKCLVDAGAMSIMGAYNLVNGDHCCESKHLLTDILRDEWNFEGFSISDFIWGVYDAAGSINAGLDIEMPMTIKYRKVPKYLKKGAITEEQIDEHVQHILAGLIKVNPKWEKAKKKVIASKEHAAVALEVAKESPVLLKNDGILPLKKGTKIGVVGRYADDGNVGDHGSSWVHSPYVVSPYEGLCKRFGKSHVTLGEAGKLKKLKKCDAIVVIVGSDYKDEGEFVVNKSDITNEEAKAAVGGDRFSLHISDEEVALIREARSVCDNVIVSIIGGSAYVISEWEDEVPAILETFYAGMEGGHALAAILAGDVNPSGHLPFTMAKDEADYPEFRYPSDPSREITYGYYHGYTLFDKEDKAVDYPFGYGLSYTTFDISKLKAKVSGDTVTVSVKVKNTGKVDGKTVVQVYAGSKGAKDGADRPVKLLKGFEKVDVKAGKTVSVDVPVLVDDLKFYDESTKSWILDPAYTLYVGEDSKKAMDQTVSISF